MSYQQEVFRLLSAFAGTQNMLTVPRAFCEMTGSLEAGMFLSQLIYWADKGGSHDGWFYKSYQDWYTDAFLSEYHVRKYAREFKKLGLLETKLKKANGSPTVHYKVNQGCLSEWILKNFRNEPEKLKVPIGKNSDSYNKETKNTSETTTEIARGDLDPLTESEPAKPDPAPAPTLARAEKAAENMNFDGPADKTPKVPTNGRRAKSGLLDFRKLIEGYIPGDEGATGIEVYHEIYSTKHALSKSQRNAIVKTVSDLNLWRTVVTAWSLAGNKPGNVGGMLDWYEHPDRLPANRFTPSANGHASGRAQNSVTAYAEKERQRYEEDFGPDTELTPEQQQWFWEQKRQLDQNRGV